MPRASVTHHADRFKAVALSALLALAGTPSAFALQPEPTKPATPVSVEPTPARATTPGKVDDRPANVAASAENAPMANEMTPELNDSVRRGLAQLAAMQNVDGSFGSGRWQKNVAVSALAGLAFMADGHLPGRGQYGPNVQRCLDFVLACSSETGLIAGESTNGPMYGHGFATLFLGEVYGMTMGGGDTRTSERVHEALLRATRLIERTQNEEGGWRYNPVPFDADVSVTICQIMALRSARNAGLEVPKSTIDKAVEYVRKCQNADGGFKYQLDSGVSAWPRSAAGVASLYYAGIYQDNAIDKGVEYLLRSAMPDSPTRSEAHYFYGVYYTAQAMYLAGGKAWQSWWPATRTELMGRQRATGEWQDPSVGNAYGTAMALIVLQMPKRYLPIFQK
jgi:hypothetical protein